MSIDIEPNVSNVLLLAADLLEVDGWRRGSYGSKNPAVSCRRCAAGAIATAVALIRPASSLPLLEVKAGGVLARAAYTIWGIEHWNDHVVRDRDEVVSTMRTVASRMTT